MKASADKPKLEFEQLKRTPDGFHLMLRFPEIYRSKVPGGWLVIAGVTTGHSITFMPDPQHQWTGGSLP